MRKNAHLQTGYVVVRVTLAALVDDIGRDDAVIHRQISARGFLDKLVDEVLYGQV